MEAIKDKSEMMIGTTAAQKKNLRDKADDGREMATYRFVYTEKILGRPELML